MTKEQAISIIKEAAERHGFTTCKYTMTRLIEIKEPGDTHYLNFTIWESFAEDTDWSKREVTMNLHFRASLASMGGGKTSFLQGKIRAVIRSFRCRSHGLKM